MADGSFLIASGNCLAAPTKITYSSLISQSMQARLTEFCRLRICSQNLAISFTLRSIGDKVFWIHTQKSEYGV